MKLPPKAFWTVHEAAMCWGCHSADVAGWSIAGNIELQAGIPPVVCDGQIVCGLVAIPAADILPLFRRHASRPTSAKVRRVCPTGEDSWMMISDPAEGLAVEAADVMIAAAELARFEDEHGLLASVRRWGSGPEPRYDWDGMMVHVCRRIHEMGLPETQAELVGEMQEWFGRRGDGVPDDRSVRRRITPIWRALRGSD